MPASWKNVWSDAAADGHLAQVAAVGLAQHLGQVVVAVGVHVRHGVRRADHVEVDVGVDPVALGPVERRGRSGASRAGRAPPPPRTPRGPSRPGGFGPIASAASIRVASPLPLSSMPGPPGDGVEVAARHDDAVLAPARRLGDHVLGAAAARGRVDAHGRARCRPPSSPSARVDTTTTGIPMPGAASVPLGTPRLLRTSSWMTSAFAPARSAFSRLVAREALAALDQRDLAASRARRSRPRRSRGPSSRSVAGGATRAGVAQHLEVVRAG